LLRQVRCKSVSIWRQRVEPLFVRSIVDLLRPARVDELLLGFRLLE
jgi:hypothetical protein